MHPKIKPRINISWLIPKYQFLVDVYRTRKQLNLHMESVACQHRCRGMKSGFHIINPVTLSLVRLWKEAHLSPTLFLLKRLWFNIFLFPLLNKLSHVLNNSLGWTNTWKIEINETDWNIKGTILNKKNKRKLPELPSQLYLSVELQEDSLLLAGCEVEWAS